VFSTLTCSARKRELYELDPYFRDGWDDLAARWGGGNVARILFDLAPVIFRPDALAARGVHRGLQAIGALGFVPIASATFRYDRRAVREAWRYQLNVATRDRIDVMDMIMLAADSLYVVVRRTTAETRVPATTSLSTCKGPSLPERREPHHLRRIVGPAQESVLTYVHVSDEPADIVRELGIFFDRVERTQLLSAIDAGREIAADLDSRIAELYGRVPPHCLLFADGLDRIEAAVHGAPPPNDPAIDSARAQIGRLCADLRAGASRDWRRLLTLIGAARIRVDHWDTVAVAAAVAERHIDAATIVPDVSALDWKLTTPMAKGSGR
jgi:hypothetical protein